MASLYRRGRTWWAKCRAPDGTRKRVSLGTTRKAEALDLLAELTKSEREQRLGIGNGRTNHKPLAPIIEAFMRERSKVLRDATVRSYRLSLAHVLPGVLGFEFEKVASLETRESFENLLRALGNRLVSDISGSDVSAWRSRRAEQVSLKTASIEVSSLKTILGWAEDLGEIQENPLRGIKPLRSKGDRRPRALRREELDALIAASPRHLALAWRMLASTGMRASEFTGLDWRWIDLTRRFAFVRETKTGEPRTVPVSRALAGDLGTWREERRRKGEPVGEDDPAFVNKEGKRWDRSCLRKRLLSCARAAGLDLDGVTTHALRHTFVSLALDAGMPIGRVKAISGHRTLEMLAHYTHGVSDGREVAEALDGGNAQVRPEPGQRRRA